MIRILIGGLLTLLGVALILLFIAGLTVAEQGEILAYALGGGLLAALPGFILIIIGLIIVNKPLKLTCRLFGHDFGADTFTFEDEKSHKHLVTCVKCGHILVKNVLKHDLEENRFPNTCYVYKKCKECEFESQEKDHDAVRVDLEKGCVSFMRCKNCGEIYDRRENHNFTVSSTPDSPCTQQQKCTNCGKISKEETVHNYKPSGTSEWRRVGKQYEGRFESYICERCGHVKEEVVSYREGDD